MCLSTIVKGWVQNFNEIAHCLVRKEGPGIDTIRFCQPTAFLFQSYITQHNKRNIPVYDKLIKILHDR